MSDRHVISIFLGGFGRNEEIKLGFDVFFLCRVSTSEPEAYRKSTGRWPWLFVLESFIF